MLSLGGSSPDKGESRTRLLRICPSPPHLQDFRSSCGLDSLSFDEQIAFLRMENLLLPGGWADAMAREGFEVFETLPNDTKLQEAWAREHSIAVEGAGTDLSARILVEQVRTFQPEVIFIYAGALALLPRDARDTLRAACRERVFVTGLWGDELPGGFRDYREFLGDLDLVFCANNSYEKKIRDLGIPAVVLGNCFDDTIAYQAPSGKKHDFVFCGTTGYGYPDHIQRYEQLRQLMARTELEVWAKEPRVSFCSVIFAKSVLRVLGSLPLGILRMLERFAMKLGISKLARASELGQQIRKNLAPAATLLGSMSHPKKNYFLGRKSLRVLYPDRVHEPLNKCSDYYALLAASRLVLNIHRDEEADIGNIRCFEATGLGACLVTDRGEGLREFFDVENDIVTFETVEECIEKVSRLLEQPSEIERIAACGQRTTLSRHTVGYRCKVIAETLRMAQIAHPSRN